MFEKLRKRWKVSGADLFLIIATFALGGSLCGYIGRQLLLLSGLEKGVAWVVLYILLITILWPVSVLIVSIPLGQFRFFSGYLSRIWSKLSGKSKNKS